MLWCSVCSGGEVCRRGVSDRGVVGLSVCKRCANCARKCVFGSSAGSVHHLLRRNPPRGYRSLLLLSLSLTIETIEAIKLGREALEKIADFRPTVRLGVGEYAWATWQGMGCDGAGSSIGLLQDVSPICPSTSRKRSVLLTYLHSATARAHPIRSPFNGPLVHRATGPPNLPWASGIRGHQPPTIRTSEHSPSQKRTHERNTL